MRRHLMMSVKYLQKSSKVILSQKVQRWVELLHSPEQYSAGVFLITSETVCGQPLMADE